MIFLYTDKHQYFLQVNLNTLDIRVSYKIILSLLMSMISIIKILNVTSLQFLNKISKKLALSFWTEVSRHTQSIQNRKLVIFFQYLKKKLSRLLLCSIVMQNIQDILRGSGHVCCYQLLYNVSRYNFEKLIGTLIFWTKTVCAYDIP